MDAKVKIIKPKNGIVGKVSGRKKLMSVEIGSGATEIQGAIRGRPITSITALPGKKKADPALNFSVRISEQQSTKGKRQ